MSDFPIETPRGLPVDIPEGIADYLDEIDLGPIPEIHLDPTEVQRWFLTKTALVGKTVVQSPKLSRHITDYAFGGPAPAERVNFKILPTAKNEQLGISHLDLGEYQALVITPTTEEQAELGQAWQRVNTPEAKKAAFTVSRRISDRLKTDPNLTPDRQKWQQEVVLSLGICPPIPETNFKIVLVGLKQPYSFYKLEPKTTK